MFFVHLAFPILTLTYLAFSCDFTSMEYYIYEHEEVVGSEPSVIILHNLSVLECAYSSLRSTNSCIASYDKSSKKCVINKSDFCVVVTAPSMSSVLIKRSAEAGITQINPRDCFDVKTYCGACQDGKYIIYVGGTKRVSVYCDMTTEDGGWTVIQKRFNGTVNFTKDWQSYKLGFGDVLGEHWLGNENIHRITENRKGCDLLIKLQDWNNTSVYAKYSQFELGGSSTKYQLTIGSYSGNASDSLRYHDQGKFSTIDKDNDNCTNSDDHCARATGGWWFYCCYQAFLNGVYEQGETKRTGVLSWKDFRGVTYSLKSSVMMIRPT